MAAGFDFFLERLKDRIVLSDLVSPKVRLIKKGNHYKGLCPFHNEKTPSFIVQNNKGRYHCFGCGEHGSAIDWVMNTQGMSFMDAVESLARATGLEVPQDSEQERNMRLKKTTFLDILEKICLFFTQKLHDPEGKEALSYLRLRGVSPQIISQFRLGFAPSGNVLQNYLNSQGIDIETQLELGVIGQDQDKGITYDYFRGRLMFPIFNRQGQVIAFGGRSLNDDIMPKYLNSPETRIFHKSEMLYGGHFAAKAVKEKQKLIIVEGYMDVISLHQAGLSGAVAPLGTALGEFQLEEIWRLTSTPILCLDGDIAGQKAAFRSLERAMPLMEPDKLLFFLGLEDGEDPDSFLKKHGKERFIGTLNEALSVFDYMWKTLKNESNLTNPEGLALFSKNFKELLKTIGSTDLRTAYFEEFYKKYASEFRSSSYKPLGKLGAALPQRLDPRKKVIDILLRSILERPELLPIIEADFLTMSVFDEAKNLYQSVIDYYFSGLPLEKEALKHYLDDNGVLPKNYTSLDIVGFKELLSSSSKEKEVAALEWLSLYRRWSDFEEIRNFQLGNIKKSNVDYIQTVKERIEGLQIELQNKQTTMDNRKEVTHDTTK
jgi:DNA primase